MQSPTGKQCRARYQINAEPDTKSMWSPTAKQCSVRRQSNAEPTAKQSAKAMQERRAKQCRILLNSAQLYPTSFQLCLTVRPFGSAVLNYALHFFKSADVAQSHIIFTQFCSNLLNYVLNYLNHSLHLLNSTQCSSIMPYIYSDLQILLNDTLYFLNSAQICSIVS